MIAIFWLAVFYLLLFVGLWYSWWWIIIPAAIFIVSIVFGAWATK